MEKLCGFVAPSGEKAYFFTGDRYIRYDVEKDGIDDGYPLSIAAQWPGLFESDIDAAMPWSDGSVFFFKAGQCLSYDIENNAVLDGPRSIAERWPGLFESGIDAAVLWGSGNAYFFRGELYQRFDAETGAIDPEARSIAEDWPGAFTSGIETALWWPSGNPYFFSGDQYARHDPDSGAVVEGYPRSISDWKGLPIGPLAAPGPAGSSLSVREFFPRFSEPFEARLSFLYQDIKGLVTTGIGNLVDSPEEAAALPFVHKDTREPATREEIVAEWHLIKDTPGLAHAGAGAAKRIHTLELPESAIDELVHQRFDLNETRLAAFFPGWADWPADARLGAHSIAWAGAFFPTRWPDFTAAANSGDWLKAADQSHLSEDGNLGVAPRNKANRTLFQNAAAVAARGLDPALIYYPAVL
ncbi:hemopexin repeat-containing protein [Amycolatopsis sp. GM8]|uniref:hemopexin repeat-containing protein n=1 Tax=Amycolatopsis sp. GM8 TaxID=2896530 RepID=UPI001F2DC7C1|nr:hemopexin repeat-containing protein [Amycolatopsis sp. GM8]